MSAYSTVAAEPLPAIVTAPAPDEPRYDARTRALIEGPIAATLIRMATPNTIVMFAQASVGLVETYFVGKLGTDPLAGVALVFPPMMLMQMMSAGAMGGGMSSAIARARRRPPRRCRGSRHPRSRPRACLRPHIHGRAANRRPMALHVDGWQRPVA